MTKSYILAMAREAGLMWPVDDSGIGAALERFAGLVAAAEREACAGICHAVYMEIEHTNNRFDPQDGYEAGLQSDIAKELREAISSRGQA